MNTIRIELSEYALKEDNLIEIANGMEKIRTALDDLASDIDEESEAAELMETVIDQVNGTAELLDLIVDLLDMEDADELDDFSEIEEGIVIEQTLTDTDHGIEIAIDVEKDE